MLFPVRCYTCNKLIGHLWERYKRQLEEEEGTSGKILDEMGMKRYCCRRMFLTFVDLIDNVLEYEGVKEPQNEIVRCYKAI